MASLGWQSPAENLKIRYLLFPQVWAEMFTLFTQIPGQTKLMQTAHSGGLHIYLSIGVFFFWASSSSYSFDVGSVGLLIHVALLLCASFRPYLKVCATFMRSTLVWYRIRLREDRRCHSLTLVMSHALNWSDSKFYRAIFSSQRISIP